MTRTIEISEETYENIKDQLDDDTFEINSLQDLVGKKIFVRTVTYHLLGKVEKIMGNIVFLSSASWVADSGRFMQFVKNGTMKEVEPLGDWFFNLSSVVDGGEWKHELPKEQK